MGVLDGEEASVAELKAAANASRVDFLQAFLRVTTERPHLGPYVPVLLYETLGPSLGAGREPAALMWGAAQTCFLANPESVRRAGFADGDALFDAMLECRSGLVFTVDDYDETWRRLATLDGKVRLAVPELLAEFRGLNGEEERHLDEYPIVLSAGERRSSTANTIFRDSTWRKKDVAGALRISPLDAALSGLVDGDRARITTRQGSAVSVIEITDTLQAGHASLPNGFGLGPEDDVVGVAPNELTTTDDRDWLAGTPHHKHVRARIERLEQAEV